MHTVFGHILLFSFRSASILYKVDTLTVVANKLLKFNSKNFLTPLRV